jgi:hypothetical protein
MMVRLERLTRSYHSLRQCDIWVGGLMDWLLAAFAEAWQHMVFGGGALVWTSAIEGLSAQGECQLHPLGRLDY